MEIQKKFLKRLWTSYWKNNDLVRILLFWCRCPDINYVMVTLVTFSPQISLKIYYKWLCLLAKFKISRVHANNLLQWEVHSFTLSNPSEVIRLDVLFNRAEEKLFYNRLIQNGSIENASVSGDQITGQAPLNA